ncbi:hypothetical protein ENTCAN_05884 [Enterobacter cancerogenus ATCC 35316]|nr:hypothetical protein ENTCAN_05884 [Enterobacter cancerogenus ATCC 35316]
MLKARQTLSQTRFNHPNAADKTSHFSEYGLYHCLKGQIAEHIAIQPISGAKGSEKNQQNSSNEI